MKIKHSIVLFLAFVALNAIADDSCKHDDHNFRCVKYLKNYDGDTITFDIPGIHPLIGKNISVRVRGLDTAEVSTKNKCEKRVGLYTKEQVAVLLKRAKRVDLLNVSREKYFRILADVIVDGKSLSENLMNAGLAYAYDGGTKMPPNWCDIEKMKVRTPASTKEEK